MITTRRVALALLIVLVPLLLAGSAQASSSDVVRVAKAELAKNVSERGGDNVPRYNNGRGAIAPYAMTGGLPWSMTFASWVLQKAGHKKHLRGTGTIKIHSGGRAVAYTGAMTAAARKAGKLRKNPRPGYLAMYGDNHVEIVETVRNGVVRTTIGGNVDNAVKVVHRPRGITHYIAPW